MPHLAWLLLVLLPFHATAEEVDPLRMVGIRAELLSADGCDQRCQYTLKVLESLGGRVDVSTIAVSVSSCAVPPNGQFLLEVLRPEEGEAPIWKVLEHPSIPAFRDAASLDGLTPGQCRERKGKVADYDTGCGDDELAVGRVLFMMCPCTCCAPVPDSGPVASLSEIPPADKTLYAEVEEAWNWENPFLSVESKGVRILRRQLVPPRQVIPKLRRLPPSAWPYGRVVALKDDLPKGRLRKYEKVLVEVAEVERSLRENGIDVERWPRSKDEKGTDSLTVPEGVYLAAVKHYMPRDHQRVDGIYLSIDGGDPRGRILSVLRKRELFQFEPASAAKGLPDEVRIEISDAQRAGAGEYRVQGAVRTSKGSFGSQLILRPHRWYGWLVAGEAGNGLFEMSEFRKLFRSGCP